MKARDEVRDELREGFRYAGWAFLSLGFIALAVVVLAPVFALEVSKLYIGVGGGLIALGIAMAFPRSALGHFIVAHIDGALDKLLGKDDEDAAPPIDPG